MSKLKKRIMKNKRKNPAVNASAYPDLHIDKLSSKAEIESAREAVKSLLKEKKYNAAMEKIISLFNAGHTDSDLMYELAGIYFVNHDYPRAEKWALNSVEKNKKMQAYILLAQIYSAQEQNEYMAAALNQALSVAEEISEKQNKFLEDMLLVVELSYDEEVIAKKYPHIAKHMQKEKDDMVMTVDRATEDDKASSIKSTENIQGKDNTKNIGTKPDEASLEALLDKELAQNSQPAANVTDNIEESLLSSAMPDAKDDTCDEQKGEDALQNAQSAANSIEAMLSDEPKSAQPAAADTANDTIKAAATDKAQADLTAVLQEDTSLLEKIKKLNALAAKYYMDNDLQSVQMLLESAFSIDSHNEGTLRNLVYLSLKHKNKEEALNYALKMPIVSIEVLDKIQQS